MLSAHLSAAMCRWLMLVAEFDRREGWRGWGLRSCAHWLNWKCGLSMGAAHEHVRVAHRLSELPVVRHAFSVGQLSYSKARALTRMATPASEAELVDLARHATAAHLERLARARRAVRAGDEREEANRRHEARHVHWFFDDDGSLVLTARLDPEEGALVLQALDAASHALRNRAQTPQSSAEDTGADRELFFRGRRRHHRSIRPVSPGWARFIFRGGHRRRCRAVFRGRRRTPAGQPGRRPGDHGRDHAGAWPRCP